MIRVRGPGAARCSVRPRPPTPRRRRRRTPPGPRGDESAAAAERELDGLRAAIAADGAEIGVGAWFAEEEGWPELGWPGGEAGLAYYAEEARRELFELRRCPTLAPWRARTGWREGMTGEEEAALERRWSEGRGAP